MTKLDILHMNVAIEHAKLSHGKRLKVGAVMVTEQGTIIGGCNGLATGGSNILETENGDGSLVTKPEVIHAELNCVLRAAREGISAFGCTIYVTHSPCLVCAEMLIQVGVRRVIYRDLYRCTDGIDRLKEAGICVDRLFYEED